MADNQAPQLFASSPISPSTFVMLDPTNGSGAAQGNMCQQATANAKIIGISMEGTDVASRSDVAGAPLAANTNESFKLYGLGSIANLKATNGWTTGDELEADASGNGITTALTGLRNIGAIALTNTNAGELGLVQIVIFEHNTNAAASFTAPITITGANANALAVGPSGSTNPTLQVNTNAASAATGLDIVAAAAGSGVQLIAISSGAGEGITVQGSAGSGGTAGGTAALLGGTAGTTATGSSATVTGGAPAAASAPSLVSVNPAPGTGRSLNLDISREAQDPVAGSVAAVAPRCPLGVPGQPR